MASNQLFKKFARANTNPRIWFWKFMRVLICFEIFDEREVNLRWKLLYILQKCCNMLECAQCCSPLPAGRDIKCLPFKQDLKPDTLRARAGGRILKPLHRNMKWRKTKLCSQTDDLLQPTGVSLYLPLPCIFNHTLTLPFTIYYLW